MFYFISQRYGGPAARAKVFAALPLFTPISMYPLDPT